MPSLKCHQQNKSPAPGRALDHMYIYCLAFQGKGYEDTLMEWRCHVILKSMPLPSCFLLLFLQDASVIKTKMWLQNKGPRELFISLHSYKCILLFPAFLLKGRVNLNRLLGTEGCTKQFHLPVEASRGDYLKAWRSHSSLQLSQRSQVMLTRHSFCSPHSEL